MSRGKQQPCDYLRDKMITIRISAPERALIKRAADAKSLSVGAYLIGLALPDGLNTKIDDEADSSSAV